MMIGPAEAAAEALRWVSGQAVPAAGGVSWPARGDDEREFDDELHSGTSGLLVTFAEARLSGIGDFDQLAQAAAGRLRTASTASLSEVAARARGAGQGPLGEVGELGLYFGLAGHAAALQIWAAVSGDSESAGDARGLAVDIAGMVTEDRPLCEFRDVLTGEAGVLLALHSVAGAEARPAISLLADRLAAQATWTDGEPDWRAAEYIPFTMPNFSHGAAGIGYALATAAAALQRQDLLDLAVAAARRLVRLGTRPDGTIAVPHSIPLRNPEAAVSYGWCHGPVGTLRFFQLLEQLQPGDGWAGHAEACRQAVRRSGLPERRYPGFWDNLGQCCGTASVGEMALDRYQETGDPAWLDWAAELAADVLDRSIIDDDGVRWSHTEHKVSPPELPPSPGWMQGAAGIAGWLLRLTRVQQDAAARRITWPDQPDLPDQRDLPDLDASPPGASAVAGTPSSAG